MKKIILQLFIVCTFLQLHAQTTTPISALPDYPNIPLVTGYVPISYSDVTYKIDARKLGADTTINTQNIIIKNRFKWPVKLPVFTPADKGYATFDSLDNHPYIFDGLIWRTFAYTTDITASLFGKDDVTAHENRAMDFQNIYDYSLTNLHRFSLTTTAGTNVDLNKTTGRLTLYAPKLLKIYSGQDSIQIVADNAGGSPVKVFGKDASGYAHWYAPSGGGGSGISSIAINSNDISVSNSPLTANGTITLNVKRKAYVAYGDSANLYGTSYTAGALASTPSQSWAKETMSDLGQLYINYGTPGEKTNDIVYRYFSNSKAVDVNVNLWYEGGANDVFRTWNTANNSSLYQICGSLRTIIANHFLKTAIAASDLSRTGTWSTETFSGGPVGGKANIQLSGNVKKSSNVGSTATATITGDNVVIGTFNVDGTTTKGGRFAVTSDGVSIGKFSNFYKAGGKYDTLFNNTTDTLTNDVFFARGLGSGTHTIVITVDSVASGGNVFIDYVGTLAEPNNCKAIFVTQMPWVIHGYETHPPAPGTYEAIDTAYDNVINEFNDWPVFGVPTKKYMDSATGIDPVDGLHPNDIGSDQMKAAELSVIANVGQKAFPPKLTLASTIINSGTDKGVLYNDNGILNHDASNFIWNKTTHRLGIGTTSPITPVHVYANGTYVNGITIEQHNASYPALLFLANDQGTGNGGYVGFGGTSHNNGALTSNDMFVINGTNNGYATFGCYGSNGVTRFLTNGAVQAQIDAAGNFLINTTTTIPSAKLVVNSNNQGVLIPRMTTSNRTGISSPAEGLLVYDTDLHKLFCYDGTTWQAAW